MKRLGPRLYGVLYLVGGLCAAYDIAVAYGNPPLMSAYMLMSVYLVVGGASIIAG